jgi:hypothetical protein
MVKVPLAEPEPEPQTVMTPAETPGMRRLATHRRARARTIPGRPVDDMLREGEQLWWCELCDKREKTNSLR